MKLTLLSFLMLFSIVATAQTSNVQEYAAPNGKTYKVGDTIKLGRGSDPQGHFRFLELGGWGAIMTNDSRKDASQNNIGRAYNGMNVAIKKIKQTKSRGAVKTIFVVGGGAISNFNLVIDDAIANCEVADCDNKKVETVVAQESNLDKLKKLKELFDAGVLTKEEYNTKKAKILETI
ncbi:MAG: SHOCT domain-containing protein [Sphingobacteriales bacterium]|nr:MAG: SHOCT domain-containing protein [Sphingobacteriales bacterium]